MGSQSMKLITLYLPVPWIQALDHLVRNKQHGNRAQAVRAAVRDLLIAEAWNYTQVPVATSESANFSVVSPTQNTQEIRAAQMRRDFRKYFWGGGRDSQRPQ